VRRALDPHRMHSVAVAQCGVVPAAVKSQAKKMMDEPAAVSLVPVWEVASAVGEPVVEIVRVCADAGIPIVESAELLGAAAIAADHSLGNRVECC
jgi:hypothetical protein